MPRRTKTYEYRIYRHGTYLGILNNVKSDFSYSQQINTAGAQMYISVQTSPDIANDPISELLTEAGDTITTEDSSSLTTEHAPEPVGDSDSNGLIQNDNDVVVWEYSDYNPNGKIVFSGYISRWKAVYGTNDNIEITCLTQSQDLNHHLMPGGNALVLDQSQTDKSLASTFPFAGSYGGNEFIIGAAHTNLAAITLWMQSTTVPFSITLNVHNNITDAVAGVTPLATQTITVGTTLGDYQFVFSTALTVVPGQHLFFSIPLDNLFFGVSANGGGGPYASGQEWFWQGASTLSGTDQDFYFKTYYTTGSTTKTYTNEEVSDILDDFFDSYLSEGGLVAKDPAGFSATGVIVPTQSFKVNTTLEGIQKIKDLGPADWYYFVDVATNTLYYNQTSTTADHTLIKGRHIDTLEIEATKENIVNLVYFSGGDDGTGSGENVFVRVADSDSITANRIGLARISDIRVQGTDGAATGAVVAQNLIDQNNAQTYATNVTVIEGAYDTSLFQIGQVVDFAGFGGFADRLLLQIVAKTPTPDGITLSLGFLPKRATAQVEDIQRGLAAAQTNDNPTAPS